MIPKISRLRSKLCIKVCQVEQHNPHVIKVYHFWYQHNVEEDISRTFIKMERCQGNFAEYLNELQIQDRSIESHEITDIMLLYLMSWHIALVLVSVTEISNCQIVFPVLISTEYSIILMPNVRLSSQCLPSHLAPY